MPASMYDQDLDRNPANYVPLTPISFLVRAARVFPGGIAVVHGQRRITYSELLARCRRLASALAARGVGRGTTVAVLAPGIPAMLEAHYGVPMTGGVLCAINTRLDAPTVAFILGHSEARVFLVDRELAPLAKAALAALQGPPPLVIGIDDDMTTAGEVIGEAEYEAFLAAGDPDWPVRYPADEWDAISLGYTSGTTGNPKGVVSHHRGATLNALGNALAFGITPASVYLWTLPMFHCNGWTFPWAVTAQGGTHVCLRRVDPALIFAAIVEHGVTHLCGAPVVLTMLIHAPEAVRRDFGGRTVNVATGGAAPPTAVLEAMERLGFTLHHVYGLTETYGPLTYCVWQPGHAALPQSARGTFLSRQGVPHPTAEDATVLDPNLDPVPADGRTIGEVMLRGNTVMKGYLKNPAATRAAFAGGWFHSGDLAVRHPDAYLEMKDRSKDIIISGGENVSSLEVEEVLYRHPAIMEAAVVAHPDEKWGEVPHAFVTPRPGAEDTLTEAAVIEYCRANMAHFKAPRYVDFVQLPKTSTGKIQKYELRRQLAGSTPG